MQRSLLILTALALALEEKKGYVKLEAKAGCIFFSQRAGARAAAGGRRARCR